MTEETIKAQVSQVYRRLKSVRLKAVLLVIVIYICMLIVTFPRWIRADHNTGIVILCGVVALVLTLAWLFWVCIREMKRFDPILLEQCDSAAYLNLMKCVISYGKVLKLKGIERSVFLLFQQRMAVALIANGELDECRSFLEEGWTGKKNSRLYAQTVMNLKLKEAFDQSDKIRYKELFQNADAPFKKNRLFMAQKLFLEDQYEEAAAFLNSYEPKVLYQKVSKEYLLGKCYEKTGERKQTYQCMRYVSEYGNTMPSQGKAREWIEQYEKESE